MTIYYVDLENGNDGNDGLSFANRKKTIPTVAAGDSVRIMASPDATSIGTATWTKKSYNTTTSGIITGATNATPIVITKASHGFSDGDTVYIAGAVGNTGVNGIWEITNVSDNNFTLINSVGNGTWTSGGTLYLLTGRRVMLTDSTTTMPITGHQATTGRTAWTPSANASATLSTAISTKTNYYTDSINLTASFATGKIAYKTLSTMNLSGYQQLSFLVQMAAGTVNAGDLQIKLCSDTLGATAVNTFNFPAIAATNIWQRVTIDLGSAMGSNINSIALYNTVDRGAINLYLDNIIACKAPSDPASLTHASLISMGEEYYGIQSIVGSRVLLSAGTTSGITSLHPQWYGTTGSYTTYKKESVNLGSFLASATVWFNTTTDGTSGSPITYSGGWNRTDMSTQTGKTWIKSTNGMGTAFRISNNYNNIEKFGISGFSVGIGNTTANSYHYCNFTNLSLIDNNSSGLYAAANSGISASIDENVCNGSTFAGMSTSTLDPAYSTISINKVVNSVITLRDCILTNLDTAVSGSRIDIPARSAIIKNIGSFKHTTTVFNIGASTSSINVYNLGVIDEVTQLSVATASTAPSSFSNGTVTTTGTIMSGNMHSIYLENVNYTSPVSINNTTLGNYGGLYLTNCNSSNGYYKDVGSVLTDTTVRHTASGYSWKMSPTTTSACLTYPLRMKVGSFAFNAGSLVTVKAWLRRDNTALYMKLVLPFQGIPGVTDEISSSITVGADTWEEVTITFTPTSAGAAEVYVDAFGGTTYNGYVDDVTITQA